MKNKIDVKVRSAIVFTFLDVFVVVDFFRRKYQFIGP